MTHRHADRSFPRPGHNHGRCTSTAIAQAEALCVAQHLRFTDMRRRVLTVIWENHTPIGAYDILAHVNMDGGRNAPMAVYRALDFLLAQRLIHRVASLNAFVGCVHPGEAHGSQLLICRVCRTVGEINTKAINAAVTRAAPGFTIESGIIEISGVCPHCRRRSAPKAVRHG